MSEFLFRHKTDWGKVTDLDVFQHCLSSLSTSEEQQQMYPDQMLSLLQNDMDGPVVLPSNMGFDTLCWNAIRWPSNRVALMYGTNPEQKATDMQQALGTIVAWHDGLHIAGIQHPPNAAGRVIAGKYTPQTDFDNKTTYDLFRGDIVVAQTELALTNEALAQAAKKHYTYLGYGDNIIERRFVNPAPSHFDGETERPFDTAGLITQGMIDAAWNESGMSQADRPVTFTFFHANTYIPAFLKMLSRRNQILAATPHIEPLLGDAHRIVVNGIAYELPTSLPVGK